MARFDLLLVSSSGGPTAAGAASPRRPPEREREREGAGEEVSTGRERAGQSEGVVEPLSTRGRGPILVDAGQGHGGRAAWTRAALAPQ